MVDPEATRETLLMAAADQGSFATVKALIDRGANINARCALGRTVLWYALAQRDEWQLIAELNAKDVLGQSLVMASVVRGLPDNNGVRPVDVAKFAARFIEDVLDDDSGDKIVFKQPNGVEPRKTFLKLGWGRSVIYWSLRALGGADPVVPVNALEFSLQCGFQQGICNSGRHWLFGSSVISAAHKQLLGVFRELVAVHGGARGHTPLTACITGLTVCGLPEYATKAEVAEFLLLQAPELANMRTTFGERPMFFVHTCELGIEEKDALLAVLAQHAVVIDEAHFCRTDYLARWAVNPGPCGYSKYHRFQDLTEEKLEFLLSHGAKINAVFGGQTAIQALESRGFDEKVEVMKAHGATDGGAVDDQINCCT